MACARKPLETILPIAGTLENASATKDVEPHLGSELPRSIREVFEQFDGDDYTNAGSFLGYHLMSLESIKAELEFSKSLIKPDNPHVFDETASREIIDEMVAVYRSAIPRKGPFGLLGTKWNRLSFTCWPTSINRVFFLHEERKAASECISVSLSNQNVQKISSLSTKLFHMEETTFNWDSLFIAVSSDGDLLVQRQFNDYADILANTNFHSEGVQDNYVHEKWLPVLADGCGNFIGLDFAPTEKGTTGQVINFGGDQSDRFVFAESWDDFLDLLLAKVESDGDEFLQLTPIVDVLKPDFMQS